jgi:hypothetical protein
MRVNLILLKIADMNSLYNGLLEVPVGIFDNRLKISILEDAIFRKRL